MGRGVARFDWVVRPAGGGGGERKVEKAGKRGYIDSELTVFSRCGFSRVLFMESANHRFCCRWGLVPRAECWGWSNRIASRRGGVRIGVHVFEPGLEV